MNPLLTLVKREWWEYRAPFLYIPLILSILLVAAVLLAVAAIAIFSVSLEELPAHWQTHLQSGALPALFYSISGLFIILLWLSVLSYAWSCLYNDRKDGSLLFWQSMPTSQTQMLSAKLLMGLLVAPFVAWLCLIAGEFCLWILIGIGMKLLHLPAWKLIWQPGEIIFTWLSLLVVFLIQGLWLFPLIGWLMFCSAYAKRSPLFTALMPVLVIIILEYFVSMHSYFWDYIKGIFSHFIQTWRYFFTASHGSLPLANINSVSLTALDYVAYLIFGFLVGVIFLVIAGVLRNVCHGVER